MSKKDTLFKKNMNKNKIKIGKLSFLYIFIYIIDFFGICLIVKSLILG